MTGNNGAFLISRKIFESDIWVNRFSSWFKIWIYIIGHVQHVDYKDLKRGQGYFNFRNLASSATFGPDVTHSMIDHFIRWAKSANMLATRKATHGTLVTVCNYNLYQKLSAYKSDTKSDTGSEIQAKSKRNESDNINKYDKNDKNVNIHSTAKAETLGKSIDPYKKEDKKQLYGSLIGYCLKTQHIDRPFVNYVKQTTAIKKILTAGYTEDNIRFVIDEMAADPYWRDNTFDLMNVANGMQKYMNRTVYFKGRKYASTG